MDRNLDDSLRLLFGDEGGYVNRKTDRGGPTKYGITASTLGAYRGLGRSANADEVKNLTLKEAEAIYRKSYWGQSGGPLLPDGLDYMNFDFAVNSGPARANKTLQTLVGASPDGIIGSKTVDKVNRYPGGIEKLLKDFTEARMAYLRTIGGSDGFSANGRGWTIRVTGIDPKGVWKPEHGVIGNALAISRGATTKVTAYSEGSAKANPANVSAVDILKSPDSIAAVATFVSAVAGLVSGSPVLQYALAGVVVVGALLAGISYVRRARQ